MESSLKSLIKAVEGKIVLTAELEEMAQAIHNNAVPRIWKKESYPSLMSLNEWLKDLHKRLAFFTNWIETGEPLVFWLPGFFSPQALLTAALQRHSRTVKTAIDNLHFVHKIIGKIILSNASQQLDFDEDSIFKAPETGIYVSGLWMTGGSWHSHEGHIVDVLPGKPNSPMPIIWFKPEIISNVTENEEEIYHCPLYVTSTRGGVISTSGASSNFITAISLPTREPSKWTLRACALLCQPN